MRIKSRWFNEGRNHTPEELAGSVAFVIWRIADNALKNTRKANFGIAVGPQYFAFLAEFLVFLIQVADRIVFCRLSAEDRTGFTGILANRVAETYAENRSRLLGGSPDEAKQRFIDQVNQRDGFSILIHGGCASIGCYAMTNAVNLEVHKLTVDALEAGQAYVPVHIFPFRMTAENFAHYETSQWRDFWSNLKEGYDLFERSHRPPRVSVCGTHYGFEASSRVEGANPGPISVCPETAQVIADLADINSRVAEQAPEPDAQAPHTTTEEQP